MNIGYAMKIGFRSIRAGAASLDRITRAGGKVRLGKNGPTVVQSAAAGIIIGQLHKASKDKKADKKADKNAVNDMKADAAGTAAGRAGRVRGNKKKQYGPVHDPDGLQYPQSGQEHGKGIQSGAVQQKIPLIL
jgi:hypothetical protein